MKLRGTPVHAVWKNLRRGQKTLSIRLAEVSRWRERRDIRAGRAVPLFTDRVQIRHRQWTRPDCQDPRRQISDKWTGREWVEARGVGVPEIYFVGDEPEAIPSFAELPAQFVVKPSSGWSSRNVFVMKNGVNVLDGHRWTREQMIATMRLDTSLKNAKPKYMVEECLLPEPGVDEEIAPDYKVYMFAERVALVHVAFRRSEVSKGANSHYFFLPDRTNIVFPVRNELTMSNSPAPATAYWDDVIEAAVKLGSELRTFMRIDFYATSRGVVFGEFTPYPYVGTRYCEWMERYLACFWNEMEQRGDGD